jgi:hypothetical protein
MKTCQINPPGFEINVPESWNIISSEHVTYPEGDWSVVFQCDPLETCNIQIGPSQILSLDETQQLFSQLAAGTGYTSLAFGKLTVDGKEHVWARY